VGPSEQGDGEWVHFGSEGEARLIADGKLDRDLGKVKWEIGVGVRSRLAEDTEDAMALLAGRHLGPYKYCVAG
jgi:hypothetical protein